jgi:hypothetical protein
VTNFGYHEFTKRHDDLKFKWNCEYDNQRAKCEHPVVLRAWVTRVQDTKIQDGVLDEDTWNFDETGSLLHPVEGEGYRNYLTMSFL